MKKKYYLAQDYKKIIKKYNIKPLDLSSSSDLFTKSNFLVGGWNLDSLKQSIKKREKFAVITGFSASGRLHLGNELNLDLAFNLKKLGGELFIPLSDTEAVLTRKSPSNIEQEFSYFKKDLTRWSFDIGDCNIYLHSKNDEIIYVLNKIIRNLKIKDFRQIYGKNIELPGMFSLANMLSDIILPYEKGFNKVFIILGVDEIRHAKLALKVINRLGYPEPSFLFTKIINGLGKGKMSKSKPHENILLSDEPTVAKNKLLKSINKFKNPLDSPPYQIAQWILKMNTKDRAMNLNELSYEQLSNIVGENLAKYFRSLKYVKY